MDIEQELVRLKSIKAEREPKGWDDYDWMTTEGNFYKGKISVLEEIMKNGN